MLSMQPDSTRFFPSSYVMSSHASTGCAFLAVFISLYFVSSHFPSSTHVALTVALVACSGPMSLANATPVHVHEPASGWRLGFPAANADAATSRHTRTPRLRIFIVLSLRSVCLFYGRPGRADWFGTAA